MNYHFLFFGAKFIQVGMCRYDECIDPIDFQPQKVLIYVHHMEHEKVVCILYHQLITSATTETDSGSSGHSLPGTSPYCLHMDTYLGISQINNVYFGEKCVFR